MSKPIEANASAPSASGDALRAPEGDKAPVARAGAAIAFSSVSVVTDAVTLRRPRGGAPATLPLAKPASF